MAVGDPDEFVAANWRLHGLKGVFLVVSPLYVARRPSHSDLSLILEFAMAVLNV
jgi:hypothetical protein